MKLAHFIAALLLVPAIARADDTKPPEKDPSAGPTLMNYIERRHTIALIEAGIITLPSAPIGVNAKNVQGGNIPILGKVGNGDATIELGIHLLYRPARDWAFGAGFLFDPNPTADSQYQANLNDGLSRTHSRAYFFIGAEGRYIPLHSHFFEGWIGAQAGAVIVADRFTTATNDPKPAIFGDNEVSLSSEGVFLGAQIGVDWIITEHVVAGLVTRYSHWFLPDQEKCTPIGDCTTLGTLSQGNVDSIEFGFTLGYRISL